MAQDLKVGHNFKSCDTTLNPVTEDLILRQKFSSPVFRSDVREIRLSCVFDREAAYLPLAVEIEKRVLVQISSFSDLNGAKLDVKSVGVAKMLNLHGVNDRSKNAL